MGAILPIVLKSFVGFLGRMLPVLAGYFIKSMLDKKAAAETKAQVLEEKNEKIIKMEEAAAELRSTGAVKRLRDGNF